MTGAPNSAASNSAASASASALVVDDDRDMCRVLHLALTSAGCCTTTAASGEHALLLAAERAFPVAFVDARLPDMDGWRLVEELRRLSPATRIIMVSGYYFADDLRVAEALQAGIIDGFLPKPFDIDAIIGEAGRKTGNPACQRRAASPVRSRPKLPRHFPDRRLPN